MGFRDPFYTVCRMGSSYLCKKDLFFVPGVMWAKYCRSLTAQ